MDGILNGIENEDLIKEKKQESPLPDKDKSNEKMYTKEELLSFMEKARSTEKAKLNDTIVKLKEKLKELKSSSESSVLSLSEKEAKISELQTELDKIKTEGSIKMSEKEKELEKKLQAAEAALEQLKKEKETIELRTKLDKFKLTKIEEVKLPKEVHDLVTGSSEKEIEESIEKAKALYEKITASVIETVKPKEELEKQDEVKKPEASPLLSNAFFAPPKGNPAGVEKGQNTKFDIGAFNIHTAEGQEIARSLGLLD